MSQEQLGRYRILEKVAAGTQGTVFRAFDAESGHLVALKVLHPAMIGDDSYLDRFHREASLASSIDHPNVVQIFDVGEDDGRHFIALEFLPENLARLIESGGFPIERAARLGVGIADGLGEIHALGIVHRDMKPQNVLITQDGTPKVTDFGIARTEEVSSMTATGALMGTPYYMSPEQARGEPATSRSDVYAAGCIIYEMLTGEVPFDAPTPLAVIRQQIEQDPRPVRSLRDNIPRAFAQVIERAMHKDPAQRYANGAELAIAIRQAIPGLRTEHVGTYRSGTADPRASFAPVQPPPATGSKVRKVATRSAAILGILIGGAAIGIVAIAILSSGGADSDPNNGGPENNRDPLAQQSPTPETLPSGTSNDQPITFQNGEPSSGPGLEPLSVFDSEQILSRLSDGATAIAEASPTIQQPQIDGDLPPDDPTPTATDQFEPTSTPFSSQDVTPAPAQTIKPTPTPTRTPATEVDPIAIWQLQEQFTFDSLASVALLADGRIVISDDYGYIWQSNNEGETWESEQSNSGCGFRELTVLTDRTAVALDRCSENLIHTNDGGRTWDSGNLDLLDGQSVGAIHFISEELGWVSGSSGLLARTTDGGDSWDRINIPTRAFLEAVNFVSEDVGWVAGLSGTLLATSDGGETWQRIRTPQNCPISSIAVRMPLIWAAGECEQVIFSADGGATWQDRSTYTWGINADAIEFLDDQTAWVTGRVYDPERSVLLLTTDAGESWDEAFNDLPGIIEDIAITVTDEGPVGWAVGSSGLTLKLVPPGSESRVSHQGDIALTQPDSQPQRGEFSHLLTWDLQRPFTFDSLFAASVSPIGNVLIGGDGGAVYRRSFGDESFAVSDLSNGCTTESVQFVSASVAFAIDSCGGSIYKTTDSGVEWDMVKNDPLPNSGVVEMYFLDSEVGWVSGWDGSFARTTNGGSSWEPLDIPSHSGLEALYFADENHGWVGGLNNAMLRTRDGGESWSKVTTPRNVCRVTAISGHMPVLWALDECSGVFVSIDSGESWEFQDFPQNIFAKTITMWNADTAWIAGQNNNFDGPSIFVTYNRGRDWKEAFITDEVSGPIYDIDVANTPDGPVGWAIGSAGLIVRFGAGS